MSDDNLGPGGEPGNYDEAIPGTPDDLAQPEETLPTGDGPSGEGTVERRDPSYDYPLPEAIKGIRLPDNFDAGRDVTWPDGLSAGDVAEWIAEARAVATAGKPEELPVPEPASEPEPPRQPEVLANPRSEAYKAVAGLRQWVDTLDDVLAAIKGNEQTQPRAIASRKIEESIMWLEKELKTLGVRVD